jgi:predicted metal-dependent peptidase
LKPKGGGGTRFAPVFAWVEKNVHDKVAGLIYLTDMEGPFSDIREPEFPVVWGNVFGREQQDVPFGHVVRVIV